MTRCVCLSTALLFLPTNLHAEEPLRAVIDRELKAAWLDQKVTPAPKSSDAEFLRRVYLDLVGTVPTFAETTRFLADVDSAKRDKLIDALLADPRFNRAGRRVGPGALRPQSEQLRRGPHARPFQDLARPAVRRRRPV